jgi:hypothetical protein
MMSAMRRAQLFDGSPAGWCKVMLEDWRGVQRIESHSGRDVIKAEYVNSSCCELLLMPWLWPHALVSCDHFAPTAIWAVRLDASNWGLVSAFGASFLPLHLLNLVASCMYHTSHALRPQFMPSLDLFTLSEANRAILQASYAPLTSADGTCFGLFFTA